MTIPETYTSIIPLLAVLVSLAAVPLIILSKKSPNLRESWTVAASFVKFGLVLTLLPAALLNKVAICNILEIFPPVDGNSGISLALRVDQFGMFFAIIASGLWIFTSFYSIGYMRGGGYKKQTR
ncbi:MAG: monovalent cation/H+ antiporter subunit D family protein, partial [bacterium]|nr:monovalent cation/H+ antiporter subunit D family protein [bacterium]